MSSKCNSFSKNVKGSTSSKSLYRQCKTSSIKGKSHCVHHQPLHNGITSLQYKALQSKLNSLRQNKSSSNKNINNFLNSISHMFGTGNTNLLNLINKEKKKSVHFKEKQKEINKQNTKTGINQLNNLYTYLPEMTINEFMKEFKRILIKCKEDRKDRTIYLSLQKVPLSIKRKIATMKNVAVSNHVNINDTDFIFNCPFILHNISRRPPPFVETLGGSGTSKIKIHNIKQTEGNAECTVTFTNIGIKEKSYKGLLSMSRNYIEDRLRRLNFLPFNNARILIQNSTIMHILHASTSLNFSN